MSFYELNPEPRALLITTFFILICTSMYCIPIVYRGNKLLPKILVPCCSMLCLIVTVLLGAIFRTIDEGLIMSPYSKWIIEIPVVFLLLLMLAIAAYLVFIIIREYHYRSHSITSSSIKESIDHLTTGLCFARPDGVVVLMNHRMDELCHQIIGTDLQNANLYWEILSHGDNLQNVERLSEGDQPSFCLSDGTVWTFKKEILDGVFQLSAADTTQEYKLIDQLKEKNKELRAMNLRIRQYGEKVDDYTREKERLETKVNIHNQLGQVLLVSRHYLKNHNSNTKEILDMWKRNIEMLSMQAESASATDQFQTILEVARSAGITVEIEGEAPKEKELKQLFTTASIEALTNAVRHADAKHIHIKLSQTEHTFIISFSNDGKLPAEKITEGGGLSSLRKKVEQHYGEMEITTIPQFTLTLRLRKEGGGAAW